MSHNCTCGKGSECPNDCGCKSQKDNTPIEMFLCEIDRLVLHPDQLYIFRKHENCQKCQTYYEQGK